LSCLFFGSFLQIDEVSTGIHPISCAYLYYYYHPCICDNKCMDDKLLLQSEVALQARLAIWCNPDMEIARLDSFGAIGAGEGEGFFSQCESDMARFPWIQDHTLETL
jgi:hypothetical protein